jgi:hypothetical protein
VDSLIIDTVQNLAPRNAKIPEYDDEMAHLVGTIAQLIEDYYVDHKLCTDKEFRDYYTEEEIEADQAGS